jgi:wyosine [tRNA(Phe)-imidazoG37] synthetase (radical SAM superfamily)
MVELAQSGRIFRETPFCHAPAELRRFNDIALSGDGEPTAHPDFAAAVGLCAEIRCHYSLADVKLVLITNGSLLHQPRVGSALEVLDANNGEIWAKLDTGTEAGHRQMARSVVPWARIIDNLRSVSQRRPIVIQSLFARLHDVPPAAAEIESYCDRLNEILAGGGQIKLVQVYTVARAPAENWVTPLTAAELSEIAEQVRRRAGVPVMAFPAYLEQRE